MKTTTLMGLIAAAVVSAWAGGGHAEPKCRNNWTYFEWVCNPAEAEWQLVAVDDEVKYCDGTHELPQYTTDCVSFFQDSCNPHNDCTDTYFDCPPAPAESCGCGGTICSGDCVDLMSDDNHCGACGNACGGGETCVDGSCVHVAGFCGCAESGVGNICTAAYDGCSPGYHPVCEPAQGLGCGACSCL